MESSRQLVTDLLSQHVNLHSVSTAVLQELLVDESEGGTHMAVPARNPSGVDTRR
jgi:hypothetical protein